MKAMKNFIPSQDEETEDINLVKILIFITLENG